MNDSPTDKQPESGTELPDSSTAGSDRSEPGAAPPMYKGAPLDADRGPGLGCFWIQIVLLVILLVATPVSVVLAAPAWFSAALLILTLVILFFAGQTTIFLLRLVAADRRTRRQPLHEGARRTVGQIEDVSAEGQSDQDDT
jgi:hypothetical protein